MRRLLLAVLGTCFCYVSPVTFAADRQIEEIVVTATKREESIQDVPIAVSAFSGDDLEKRGVQDLYGLQEVAPSIAIYNSNSTSNGGAIRIRGVGTTGNNPGLEAAVGTFIDGVYRSRAGLAFNDMVDIERVEVLRGPQGTLFGKNTVAGALNIVSKKPDFANNGSITVGAGNYGMNQVKGHANFAASDQLAFRVAGSWLERDGYYENFDGGDAYDSRDRYTIKTQALWQPRDDLTVQLIYDYTEKDEDCCPAAYYINGATGAVVQSLGGNISPFNQNQDVKVGVNYEPVEDVEDRGVSLDITWDINDNMMFRSITAQREYEVFRGQDIDFGNADILMPQDIDESFENFSQEFQLLGSTDSVDWLVGAYYYTEDLDSDEMIVFGPQGPAYVDALFSGGGAFIPVLSGNPSNRVNTGGTPHQGYDAVYFSETNGWSIFTHNTWHATKKFDVTLGLRYSDEEKKAGAIINGAPYGIINGAITGAQPVDDPMCLNATVASVLSSSCHNYSWTNTESESETTGTLKFAYQLTENVNSYASYSRGYKAGGYNLDQEGVGFSDDDGNPIDTTRFSPELSDSYELGLKGEFLDYKLTLNTALFYTEFENFQLNTFTGLGFTVGNVEEVTTEGIELEGVYQISDIASLTFGVTYADARYGDIGNPALNDNRLTQSPLWQGTAALFVEDQIPGTDWSYNFNMNFSHVGEVNTGSDLDPEKVRGVFNTVNTSLGINSNDGRWGAVIWGRNLDDVITNTLVFDSVFQGGTWSTFSNIGRTYGVTLTANFGE